MTNNLKIDTVKLQQKQTIQPQIPYRIYYMSKDGITLGGTPLDGKFPWKYTQSLARGILRHWARDLVAKHDTAQLGTILHRWAKDWSAENDVYGGDASDAELPALENLLARLRGYSTQRKVYFKCDYNKRDASIMYHLSEGMVEAIGYNLKRMIMKPLTEWDFTDEPTSEQEGSTICEWLFRRR